MSVYYCQEQDWDEIEKFWNSEFPEKFKDQTVFQMEPFPKHGPNSITFISNEEEAVKLVSDKFGLKVNKFWTSIGAQGIKRLTGKNSKWSDVEMKKIIEYVPMTKPQLEESLNKLKEFYSEFRPEYHDYENGKNKKIRENAYSNVKITIQMTKRYLWQTEEIMEILCDGDTSDFGRAIIMDEFSSPRYYDMDMSKLIRDVQEKLNQMT